MSTNHNGLLTNQDKQQQDQLEQDHDAIDYTTAFIRENQRRQRSEELVQLNDDFKKLSTRVQTELSTDQIGKLTKEQNNDVVFDVLPSFEMYNSFQYSSARQSFEESTLLPPDYRSQQPGGAPPSCPNANSASSITSTNSSTTRSNSALESYSTNTTELDDITNINLIDSAHKLPHLYLDQLQVNINVTKDVPTPFQKCEPESLLKEYTSGDVVHGFVTIHNRSNKRVQFQNFTVSLEGVVSIINIKDKKQVLKKFINMIDLSASWSHGCISPSANILYTAGDKDIDGAMFGLPKDRILEPNSSYKKFFTFKFPYNTLDTVCRHQQELHTLLPPSLGINRIKRKGQYANIDINPATCYGHNGKRGSPILTRDLSSHVSISYSINANLIGVNPFKKNDQKLAVLSDQEYCLRFIPFGFGVSLFSSQRYIDNLKKLIENSFESARRGFDLEKNGNKNVELLDQHIKLQQLGQADNSHGDSINYSFPLRNKSLAIPDFSKVETGLLYMDTPKKLGLLNKFKNSNNVLNNSNGFITISSQIPKDGLPYISPTLIRRTNEISTLNTQGLQNLDSMASQLSTSEKKTFNSISLDLKFSPSDNVLEETIPPEISQIEVNLLVINVYSSSSIPIKISSDIFLDTKVDQFNNLKKDFIKYSETLEELSDLFDQNNMDIEKYVPIQYVQDIKSMKDLNSNTFLLSSFDHQVKNSTDWEHLDSNEWIKSLQLNVNFKDAIRETLIPTFQSCLFSRMYCIQVRIVFKGDKSAILRIPIRLRQFDKYS